MRIIISSIFLVLFILTFNYCTNNNPIPTLNSITPTSKVSHMPDFTLTATGIDFVDGAKIVFNGIEKPSDFISSTELSCQIEAENIPASSTVPVLVRNPTPGGGDSNSLNFTIYGEHTFSNPINISNNSGSSHWPTITVDSSGNLNLVWFDSTPGNDEIFFSRSTDNGSTWSLPLNISNNSGGSSYPTITVDGVGNLNLAWGDSTLGNCEIFFSRSTDNGSTWSLPVNISNNSGSSSSPTITVDGVGNLNLAWRDNTPGNCEILFSRSTDNGSTWSLPINISNNSGDSYNPTITVDSVGNLNLAWFDYTTGNYEIFFSCSRDNGSTWSLPINISNNSGGSYMPTITVDSAGNLNLAWMDTTPGNGEIFFSRSRDNGSTWSLPLNISNNSGMSYNPTITVDSVGNLNLAWYDNTPGNYEIFFNRSTDNGSTWSLPVNISNNSGDSYNPTIAVDSTGNLNLAWDDTTPRIAEIYYCGSVQ